MPVCVCVCVCGFEALEQPAKAQSEETSPSFHSFGSGGTQKGLKGQFCGGGRDRDGGEVGMGLLFED